MAGQSGGGGGVGSLDVDQIIAPGILTAASVYVATGLQVPYQTFATFHILRGGSTDSNRVHLLASGWLSDMTPLTWLGFFPLQPDDHIRLNLTGNLNPVFRTEYDRLTPTADDPVTRFLNGIINPT